MEYFCCIRPSLCAYMQKMRKNIPFAFSVHADRLSASSHCRGAVGMGEGCRRCGVVFSVFLFSLRRLTSSDGLVFLFLSSSVCPVAASDAGLASKSSVASKICVQCMRPMYASKVLRRMAARMHRCVSVFVAVRDVAPTTSPYPLCRCYVWRLLFCACVIFVRRCRLLWLQPPAGEKRGRERGAVLRPMNTSSLYLSATQTSLNKPNHPFCVLICVL